jgi:hypothetical protein
VHNGTDDLGLGGTASSLTTGNSGSRLGCAVIGVAVNILMPFTTTTPAMPTSTTTSGPDNTTTTSAPPTPAVPTGYAQAIVILNGVNGTVVFQQQVSPLVCWFWSYIWFRFSAMINFLKYFFFGLACL